MNGITPQNYAGTTSHIQSDTCILAILWSSAFKECSHR